jgi:hypothetical protein
MSCVSLHLLSLYMNRNRLVIGRGFCERQYSHLFCRIGRGLTALCLPRLWPVVGLPSSCLAASFGLAAVMEGWERTGLRSVDGLDIGVLSCWLQRLCSGTACARAEVPTTGLIWAARIGSSMTSVSLESIFFNVCVGLLSRYCERLALSETRRGEIPKGSSKSLPSSLPSSATVSALSSTLGELIHLSYTLVGWDPSSASRRIYVPGALSIQIAGIAVLLMVSCKWFRNNSSKTSQFGSVDSSCWCICEEFKGYFWVTSRHAWSICPLLPTMDSAWNRSVVYPLLTRTCVRLVQAWRRYCSWSIASVDFLVVSCPMADVFGEDELDIATKWSDERVPCCFGHGGALFRNSPSQNQRLIFWTCTAFVHKYFYCQFLCHFSLLEPKRHLKPPPPITTGSGARPAYSGSRDNTPPP